MPAPQLHLSFGLTIAGHQGAPPALRRACANEPVYTRLGAIVHDLPYYGNMIIEAVRYGLEATPLDEPWAYRMHSVRPARFIASFIRAAAQAPGLSRDERLALTGGIISHCALDLTLHPLVNYCARRDHARHGGHEAVHHRLTEKYHALFLHLDRLGYDPIGTADMRRWTRVVKNGSFVRARVEAPLVAMIQDAYRGAYGNAPSPRRWCAWVRNFSHFGALVGNALAGANSQKKRGDAGLRERYYENDVFSLQAFYACSQRRLTGLAQLAYDYFDAGDFSPAAEDAFRAAARIDDLAEPTPQPEDALPELLRLTVRSTPGMSVPSSTTRDPAAAPIPVADSAAA
jgi:hypothetical protein